MSRVRSVLLQIIFFRGCLESQLIHISSLREGTALQGRPLNSLGFQPQESARAISQTPQGWPRVKNGRPCRAGTIPGLAHLALKRQAIQRPPLRAVPSRSTGCEKESTHALRGRPTFQTPSERSRSLPGMPPFSRAARQAGCEGGCSRRISATDKSMAGSPSRTPSRVPGT